MKFKLWGTRGSIPSPLRADSIENKIQAALFAAAEAAIDLDDPTAIRAFVASLPYAIRGTAGGDTACIEIRSGGNLFIFDCGSGLRQLGLELMQQEFGRGQGVAHIFISHTHWDHMMGWPFFVPAFVPGNEFYFYGPQPDLEQRFRLQQTAPTMFPVSLDYQSAQFHFVQIPAGSSTLIGQTRISNIPLNHPGLAYGYRIEDDDAILVYATDNEYKSLDPDYTQHYVDFFREADVLIFDAMFSLQESYRKEDWGHSSALAGADLATRAGAKRLLLFHHDPASSDKEIWSLRDTAEAYLEQHPERPPCEVIVAYDGLEMELWRETELETELEDLTDGLVIHLTGRLAHEVVPAFLTAVKEAAHEANDRPIVLNMAEVVQIDTAGLRALFLARRTTWPLAISDLSAELHRKLQSLGILEYLAVFDNHLEAISTMTAALDVTPSQTLNKRYQVQQRLGSNPFGEVYLAFDQMLDRQVVLQILCPSLGAASSDALIQGAQAMLSLRHPLISGILDTGQEGEIRYIAEEYTPGKSIHDLMNANGKRQPLPAEQAVRIGRQIFQALEHAHSQGVAHGGLNPQNVYQTQDTIKITGFGISRLDIDKPLSDLPAYVAPLHYLAPEQLQGHVNNAASDLYTAGTLLYEMLTGDVPFDTTDDQDLINLQLHQPPVPPARRNVQLSRSLEHLVLGLLEKSPRKRPASASTVRDILASLDVAPNGNFVLGREALQQQLSGHLERLARGQGGLVLIGGQKGIGKTEILRSSLHRSSNLSYTPLYSELSAYEDSPPYKPFIAPLERALLSQSAYQSAQLLNELGELQHTLVTLMPGLQSGLHALTSSKGRYERLEEAILETLRLLARQSPILFALDGMQWADTASLRLFQRLAAQKIPGLLLVGLYRSDAVNPGQGLYQVLEQLDGHVDDEIHIPRLDPSTVYKITATFGNPRQLPPDFGLWAYSETRGNPLHLERLVQNYIEGPSEIRHPDERAKPRSLEDVIIRSLERLSNNVLTTLRQAAVLGQTFHLDTLCLALDQPQTQVLTALNSALEAKLVRGHPTLDRYNFGHPVIRETIYTEMLTHVRRRYHWRAALALQEKGPSHGMDAKIDLLAHHFLQAEDHEQALVYLARASRRARELGAYKDAVRYLDQAITLVEQLIARAKSDEDQQHRQKQRRDLLNARDRIEETLQQKTHDR